MKGRENHYPDSSPKTLIEIDPNASAIEKAVVSGDLSSLSSGQRLEWYQSRCDAAGLDPRTQPFEYLILKGKLKLYATKACTDQLIATHDISLRITSRSYHADLGLYEAACEARFPGGRTAEDIGIVDIYELQGEALANAMMKAVTKAKRRTVLSACGLGMLDDTEIDTIPGAARVSVAEAHDPRTIAISDAPPPPPPRPSMPRGAAPPRRAPVAPVSEVRRWIEEEANRVYDHFASICVMEKVEPGMRITPFQVGNHLITKWLAEGVIESCDVERESDGKRDRDKVADVLRDAWLRRRDQFKAEVISYLQQVVRLRAEVLGVSVDEPDGEPITAEEIAAASDDEEEEQG